MSLTLQTAVYLMVSFLWNEDVIFRSDNRVTLKASEQAEVGKEYQFEGNLYLVVDDSLLRELVKSEMDLSRVITTKVTDMSYLFYESTLKDPQISHWDVSNVRTMSWMFGLAPIINPDLSHWDTRSVVDFSDMFNGAQKFQADISKWNTSLGERFNGMFFDTEFNGYLNDWDVSSAKIMSGMFDEAKLFNQPLDKWNTSNVEDMGGMFAEAIIFDQDISMWDVRKVKIMTNMFRNTINLKKDLSEWDVPLIKMEPENFSANSKVLNPKWDQKKGSDVNWYLMSLLFLLIPLYVFGKKLIEKPKTENKIFDTLKAYTLHKNISQISRAELDEILGATSKSVEAQKKIRSNFIKEFNLTGLGEISRIKDEFDSRSYSYKVTWKKQ